MSKSIPLVTSFLLALSTVACESGTTPPKPQTPAPAPAPSGDGHDHDHGGEGHSHGDEHALGTVEIGGVTLTITQDGDVAGGKEASFDIAVTTGTAPTAVRAWIGAEDGAGSVKAKAEKESAGFHAHVDAPATLAADAKLWIELELADGTKATGSIALHR